MTRAGPCSASAPTGESVVVEGERGVLFHRSDTRSEDEPEMRVGETAGREDRSERLAGNPQAIFCGGEVQDRGLACLAPKAGLVL